MSAVYNGRFVTVTKTGVSITTSGTSAGSALPTDNAGLIPRYVRVAASVAACVRMGNGAQTAVATDMLVQPGDAVIMSTNMMTHIAAIQLAAAGVVIVTPLDNQ